MSWHCHVVFSYRVILFTCVSIVCVSITHSTLFHTVCLCVHQTGRVPRAVASLNQHVLTSEDVVSCCLDLGAPSISFRINGQPVQGMFENFNTDGLFFPVVSFSAGVKWVFIPPRLSRSLLDRVARWWMYPAETWVWWGELKLKEMSRVYLPQMPKVRSWVWENGVCCSFTQNPWKTECAIIECSMCNIGDIVEKWSVGVSMLANPRIHPSLLTNFFL